MIKKFLGLPLLAGVALMGGMTTPSNAATIYALTDNNSLIGFDSSAPGTQTFSSAISGVASGDTLANIDYRPATEQIYAIGTSNQLYQITISGATASATPVGTPLALGVTGTRYGFDVNPVVDRIRVATDAGENVRVDPNTFAVTADTALAPTLAVADVAYSNSFAGAAQTSLFAVDFVSDSLSFIGGPNGTPSPNDGAVTTIGALGVDITENSALDFSGSTLYGVLQAGTTTNLYSINTTNGVATLVGAVVGNPVVRGIVATVDPVEVPKVAIKLNFAKSLSDSVSLSGALAVPAGFNVSGATVLVNVGGVEKTFTLDAKGKAKVGNDSFSISVKNKKGVVAAQLAKFKFASKKGDFAASLADEGLTNENVSKQPRAIVAIVQVGELSAQSTLTVTYTGKAGKSGSAK